VSCSVAILFCVCVSVCNLVVLLCATLIVGARLSSRTCCDLRVMHVIRSINMRLTSCATIADSVSTRNNAALFSELLARLGRAPMSPAVTQEEQLELVRLSLFGVDARHGSASVVCVLWRRSIVEQTCAATNDAHIVARSPTQVAAEIGAVLDANGGTDEVVSQLFDAFMAHVFGSGQTPVGAPVRRARLCCAAVCCVMPCRTRRAPAFSPTHMSHVAAVVSVL
jgi:hypothetical protein